MLSGHFWTISCHVGKRLRPPVLAPARHFSVDVPDSHFGSVRVTGRLRHVPGCRRLLLVVHGLGGSSSSPYMLEAAATAEAAGLSCLRLDLRGADLRGEDFFHGGLGSDLRAVLGAPACAQYDEVLLLGYSLGGHVCLTHVAEDPDPRVRALATVCSPLDLLTAATAFDERLLATYRMHVLNGLKHMYRQVAKRRSALPLSVAAASRIHSLRDWDDQIVAPRFGFRNARHYYEQASAAKRLSRIRVPTLLLSAAKDPMVPRDTLAPFRHELSAPFTRVEKARGGHVGFPADFDLGEDAAPGLANQVLAWLTREGATRRPKQP